MATPQSPSTNENTALPITLQGTDQDGNALTFAIVTGPANGALGTIGSPSCVGNPSTCSASVTYTPGANFHGSDSFTFKVNDGTVDSTPATVSITVNAVNQAPVAAGQTVSTNEDNTLPITITGTDVDSPSLTYTITSGPSHGTILPASSGAMTCGGGTPANCTKALSYGPSTNYNGPDSFIYKVNDGSLDSATATINITVNAVNDAPTFTAGGNQTVNEDSGAQSVGWATNISAGPPDEAGQTLNFIVTNNNNALFSVQPAISGMGTLTYTPAADTSGSTTVHVQLHDNGGTANGGNDTSGTQNFTLTINFVNDVPSFTKGADQAVLKNAGAQTVTGWATNISAGPANESGQTVHFNITTNTNAALFSAGPAVSPTGTLTYTPATGATGSATITLDIQDNGGTANGGVDTSGTQSFVITVQDPPQITSLNSATFQPGKTGQSFTVQTTGSPSGPTMVIGESGILPGSLSFTDNHNGTATINGTPDAGTQGTTGSPVSKGYPLTLSASNGVAPNASQNFTLNITCPTITVSGGPVADLTYNVAMSPVPYSQVGGNGALAWSISGQPSGLAIGSGTGQLTGTPSVTGTFSATVTATDAGGCIGTKAVSIAVYPVAVTDNYTGLVDNTQFVVTGGTTATPGTPAVVTNGTATFRLTNNDLPSGGVTAVTGNFQTSAGGIATIAADGTFIYTPKANPSSPAITSDSFTYSISSNTGGTPTATVTFGTVNLTLVGRVWYVKSGGSDSNNGQSQSPFLTLSKALGVSTANDTIYLYSGNDSNLGTATALKSGQSLIGQGAALVVNGSTLVAAGTFPQIGNTITLANSVTINGVNMSTGAATALSGSGTSLNVTVGSLSTTNAPSGINLGLSTGSLTVNGGTIQGSTGSGIVLSGAVNVTLAGITVKTSTHIGIDATGLSGFSLSNSSVLSNGTTANIDHGIHLLDVSGTATFTNDTVTGSHVTNLFVGGTVSSTAVTTSLTVTGGSYNNSATNSGIQVGMTHTSTLKTATFTNVTFSGNASSGLQVQSNDNSIVGDGVGAPGTGTVTISGCTFTNNAGNTAIDIDQGGGNGAGQMYARIMNNLTITGNGGPAINVFTSSSATGGTMKVRLEGNHVGNAAVSGSGSTMGPGIRVFLQGKTTNTVTIVNNVVRQTPGSRAIDVEALGPVTTGQPLTVSDITITGNDANTNDQGNPSGSLDAIYVAADNQGSAAEIRAEIHGNTLPSGGCFDWPTFDGNAPWLYYRIATSGAVAQLVDFNGPHANANAAISTTQTSGTAGAGAGVTLIAGPINTVQ